MKNLPACRLSMPCLGLILSIASTVPVRAQEVKTASPKPPRASSIEAINIRYHRELEALERQRLEQLGELAANQPKAEAETTYLDYFQLAIAKGLYRDAEATAQRLTKAGVASTDLQTLAHLVKIVGEADRGAYDDSLKSLAEVVGTKDRQPKPAEIPGLTASSRASIVEAYYQRLVRGNQYEVARKAMKMVAENGETPAVRDLAARRATQLEMVGRVAPPIAGTDIDGMPFRLEQTRGDVVLLVFWASWCLPSAQEIPWLEEAYRTYHDRGFRIVGIDVDNAQASHSDPKTVIADVRKFLVEFNVPWTTLINGQGDQDLTRPYSVTEVPANVLIGRDGKVIHLDLAGPRLDQAVADAVARKP